MEPSIYSIICAAIGIFCAGVSFGMGFCVVYLRRKGMLKSTYETKNTKCPLCKKLRVSDGMCWEKDCDYKEWMNNK